MLEQIPQKELFKNVRAGLEAAQQKATARLETLNGDARRALEGLITRGRESQRELSEKLQQVARPEQIEEKLRPVADRVTAARTRVIDLASTKARGQAAVLASELRRWATRLDGLTQPAPATVEAEQQATETDEPSPTAH